MLQMLHLLLLSLTLLGHAHLVLYYTSKQTFTRIPRRMILGNLGHKERAINEYIEAECKELREDPEREAKAWLQKLFELDREPVPGDGRRRAHRV
jgi:hypothetical protein